MPELSRCRWCDKPMRWVETTKGGRMPLDPESKPWEPDPDVVPNVVLEADGRARVLTRAELAAPETTPRFVCHFASCAYSARIQRINKQRRERLEREQRELDELLHPEGGQ